MAKRSLLVSTSALVALVAAGCQTAPAAGGNDAAMRAACTERAATMYGVAAAKVELPPSFGTGDTGNKILNGQVDKGPDGFKAFRCIYDAANALVDVMAMTPDGE
jgi:hypothetical protein